MQSLKLFRFYLLFAKIFHQCPLDFPNKLHYVTTFLVSFGLMGLSVFSFWNRVWEHSFELELANILGILVEIFITIVNCYNIISVQFMGKQWKHLLSGTKTCNLIFGLVPFVLYFVEITKLFWKIFTIGRSHGVFRNFIINAINRFLFTLSIGMLNITSSAINDHACCIKTNLSKQLKLIGKTRSEEVVVMENLKRFIVVFKKMDDYNKVFGMRILGMSIYILLHITRAVINCLEYVEREEFMELCYMTIFSTVTMVIYSYIFINPCVNVGNIFHDILNVSCKILVKLSNDPNNQLIKKTLILLNKQIEFRKPYFSAAGFFKVNYAIYMYIFGGVTSFVVLYIQLKNIM